MSHLRNCESESEEESAESEVEHMESDEEGLEVR